MPIEFRHFQIIQQFQEHNDDILIVRMRDTGTEYRLVRGLDPHFRGRFKLQIGGQFFRTPSHNLGMARREYGTEEVAVEFTSGHLKQITERGL